MAKDNSLFIILGVGAVAWWGYTQGWFSSFFAPVAAAPPAPPSGVPTATPCAAPNMLINGICTPPATASANPPTITQYGGPGVSTNAQALVAAALATAAQQAGAGANLNVDQWAYYYGQIPGPSITIPNLGAPSGTTTIPGQPAPLSGSQIDAILTAAGATGANRSTTLMSAAQFVYLVATAGGVSGLSGVGAYRRYTLGDLRRVARGY